MTMVPIEKTWKFQQKKVLLTNSEKLIGSSLSKISCRLSIMNPSIGIIVKTTQLWLHR